MKSRTLRCKAKTRKGVLLWLQAFNPFLPSEQRLHDAQVVAVHVNRHTGAIHSYELPTGKRLTPSEMFYFLAAIAA